MLLREVSTKQGTYAGVRFDEQTTEAIKTFQEANKIGNPVSSDKLHTTLLYSRKFLPDYTPAGEYDKPMVGSFKGFDVWESQPDDSGNKNKCLVMEYSCPDLTDHHNKLMGDHDASYDFDEYKPHITLSYDYDGDVDKLPKFKDNITIQKEYGEDLNLDWAKDNT